MLSLQDRADKLIQRAEKFDDPMQFLAEYPTRSKVELAILVLACRSFVSDFKLSELPTYRSTPKNAHTGNVAKSRPTSKSKSKYKDIHKYGPSTCTTMRAYRAPGGGSTYCHASDRLSDEARRERQRQRLDHGVYTGTRFVPTYLEKFKRWERWSNQ